MFSDKDLIFRTNPSRFVQFPARSQNRGSRRSWPRSSARCGVVLHVRVVHIKGFGRHLLNVLQQVRLIVLHGEHSVAATRKNLLEYLLLTTHRINGHRSTFYIQELNQMQRRCDLVRLLPCSYLGQGQMSLDNPGTAHVRRICKEARRIPSMHATH